VLKTFTKTAVPAFYRGPSEEVEPGDLATIFLDQERNADFPASIGGTVLTVSDVIVHSGGCGQNGKAYVIQYDTADLPDGVSRLDACDVVTVAGTSCCASLRTDLDAEIAARETLETEVDTWDMQTFSGVPTNGSPGVPQVETQTAVGTILTDGTLINTVTGVGITGSPLAIPFNVEAGDVPSVWAAKAAASLAANAAVSALYAAGSIGADYALTEKVANGNDGTLNIALTLGTATGATPDPTSTNTVAGVAAVAPSPVPERVGQRGKFGKRTWVAIDLYEWVEEVNEENGIVDYGFTAGLGGTPTSLDSLPVNSEMAGHKTLINGGVGFYFYALEAGTDAENSPYVIHPDNFDAGTNAFVWKFKSAAVLSDAILDATSGGGGNADAEKATLYSPGGGLYMTGQWTVLKDGTAFSASFLVSGLTANRALESPNASGTVALAQTVTQTTPLTGNTISVGNYVDQSHFITPAGTLAALTITLPAAANSRLGQVVKVWITQAITALTVNVSGGGTILGTAFAASAYTLGTPLTYECVSTTGLGIWTRRQ